MILNQQAIVVNAPVKATTRAPFVRLADFLRDDCGLKGINQACDTAQCGACTVLVNGAAVKSCNVLVAQVSDATIDTIEATHLHALRVMQDCFIKHHALQCGYCTSGMLMRAVAMVAEGVPPYPEPVRHALAGNLCRCTGYQGIVDAICEGLTLLNAEPVT